MTDIVLRPVTADNIALFEARFYDESGTGEYAAADGILDDGVGTSIAAVRRGTRS